MVIGQHNSPARRGHLLRAALGFSTCSMPSYDRALWARRTWLDSWSGVGTSRLACTVRAIDLQVTRYDERGWRATFYTTRMEHSLRARRAPRGSARRGARGSGACGGVDDVGGAFLSAAPLH
jgi:hypothetical protein